MHGKEEVLLPALKSIGVKNVQIPALDTDQFGTFSGEINRLDDPIKTLRKKCVLANKMTGNDLVIASEGSFGAHPFMPFACADEELLMLKDFKNSIEIVVKELSTETNFSGQEISDLDELQNFANNAGFPDHALILKGNGAIEKGISDAKLLEETFWRLKAESHHKIMVETDMRAMHNPTRMKVISTAASKLKQAILATCPECHFPNFTVKELKFGLPCGLCQMPTESVKCEVKKCDHCGLREEKPVEKNYQDPMYCNYCNP